MCVDFISFQPTVQSEMSFQPEKAMSTCSVTSSVMGPPTYRPPYPDPDPETKPAPATKDEAEDVDARIKQVKARIETEMKERWRYPPAMFQMIAPQRLQG